MQISLLIATINRKAELERLLESLCNQTYKNFHVLIGDQNPLGFLDDVLSTFCDRLQITVVPIQSRGISAARNALLPYIQGDIVAFPDDDCLYLPDTLEKVIDFFRANEHVGGLMGVWGDDEALMQKNIQKFTNNTSIARRAIFFHSETFLQFYKCDVVAKVGKFDVTLGPGTGLPYGGGEDTDYALRALDFAQIRRVTSVRIFHPELAKERAKEKIYAYAYGRMYLLRKHNFPLWFKFVNILFPLYRLLQEDRQCWYFCWHMFVGRLYGLFQKDKLER